MDRTAKISIRKLLGLNGSEMFPSRDKVSESGTSEKFHGYLSMTIAADNVEREIVKQTIGSPFLHWGLKLHEIREQLYSSSA